MATIVREGRDPWWTPLAVNILGGLWNDWQQRERNKKEAAYLGELERMRSEMTGNTGLEQGTQPPQDNGQGLLNTSIPEGYNNNGWANAFHKTDTPLTQFDLGTAGLVSTTGNTAPVTPANAWTNALGNSGNPLPQFNAGGTTPTQPQGTNGVPIVTPMDFYNAAMQLAGTKRFGMISPDRIQALLTPYMKANEEAWRQKMRDNVADQYMNATDGAGRVRAVTGSMIRGITPESMANIVFNQNSPKQSTVDAGGRIHVYNTDPTTGMPINTWTVDRTLTPQEIAQNEYNNAKLQADINSSNADRRLEYYKVDQNNNQYQGTFTDANGVTWVIRKNGERDRLSEAQGLTEQQKETLKNNGTMLTNIQSRREQLQKEKNAWILKGATQDDSVIKSIDEQIKGLNAQEQRILQENRNILNLGNTGSGNTGQPTEQSFPPAGQTAPNNENTVIPMPPAVPPIARAISNDVTPDMVNSTTTPDITQLGRNDAVSSTELLASDRNTEAGIQRALDELNGQFGEQRWQDWATGLDFNNIVSNINNRLDTRQDMIRTLPGVPIDNPGIRNLPGVPIDNPSIRDFLGTIPTNPNNPIKILGVPLVYPNGDYNRYAIYGGRDLADRDLRSPEEKFRDIVPIPNAPINEPMEMVLASNRRTQPQQVLSGRYYSDTRNGGQYTSIINKHAKAHNVDPDLIAAMIQQESSGNSRAVSSKGAGGLMQLMPKTARGLGVTDVFDPDQNIAGGTKYIAQLLRQYKGNVEKALWAYNAGPGNVKKGRLPEETRKYIPSVMARYRRLKGIATGNPSTPKRTTRRRRKVRSRRRR